MTSCDCQDPLVFGHQCPATHTTCSPSETYTAIAAAFRHITSYANQTTWNWTELAQTIATNTQPRETPTNPAKGRGLSADLVIHDETC
jgi:hypothetical protein